MNLDGPTVLMVRILGAQVYREWLDLKDPWIKKSLLHPSTAVPPAGILRVRLTRAFTDTALKTITGSVNGDYVEIRVPRQ